MALDVWEGYRKEGWHPFVVNSSQPWIYYSAEHAAHSKQYRVGESWVWKVLSHTHLPTSISMKPQTGNRILFKILRKSEGG